MAASNSRAERPIVLRADAKKNGLTRYFTGEPCKYGHVAERLTSNGFCNECQRLKDRRTYWGNLEAARTKHATYRAAHPDLKDRRRATRHAADKDLMQRATLRRAVRQARKDAVEIGAQMYVCPRPCATCGTSMRYTKTGGCVECNRRNCRRHKSDPQNKAYYRQAEVEWRTKNPERYAAIRINSKHRRRAQEAGGVSTSELHAWRKAQRKVCYWCGRKCERNFTIDHYLPLARGGRHELSNLVIACRTCNCRKHVKDPEKFRAELWPESLFSITSEEINGATPKRSR